MFNKICIVGTGLIGASLALVLRRKNLCEEIIGVDRSNVIEQAIDSGIIDYGYSPSDIEKAVKNTDIVFLAVPIKKITEHLKVLHKYISKDTIVTDVGSSKEYIVNFAQQEFNGNGYFIGGHPMAGSEKRGLTAADPFLFENCFYVGLELFVHFG